MHAAGHVMPHHTYILAHIPMLTAAAECMPDLQVLGTLPNTTGDFIAIMYPMQHVTAA